MAPPKMNFQSGFLNDTSDLDESKLDDSLRSFISAVMLSGSAPLGTSHSSSDAEAPVHIIQAVSNAGMPKKLFFLI